MKLVVDIRGSRMNAIATFAISLRDHYQQDVLDLCNLQTVTGT